MDLWIEQRTPPAEEDSGEVVLTYDPGAPEDVVLTYSAPLPAVVCPGEAEPAAPARPPRRHRWWKTALVIVLCLALMASLGLGVGYVVVRLARGSGESWDGGFYYEWDLPPEEGEGGETTIASYPTGGNARIKPLETHGEALTSQEIYEQVNPSVVAVVAYSGYQAASGTGVIISEDGYIVTNYHVVEGAAACDVLFYSGLQYGAKLVGYDEENDLAVLKIEADGLPAAEFGSSDLLTVGDTVYAIGNPLGLELRGTFTDGMVSAINRDVDVDGTTMTLIQTNAALNSGNSGGPLINAYGQVVGINTIKMVATYEDEAAVEGLGFAIPSSTVAHIVNSLIATGRVEPQPVLGITVQGLVTLPDGNTGVQIIEVTPDLGGDLAGIRAGDVIVSADGELVASNSDVLRVRRRYQAGEYLPMVIYRDGEYLEVEVLLMAPVDAAA